MRWMLSLSTTEGLRDLVLHVGDGGVSGPVGGWVGSWWW